MIEFIEQFQYVIKYKKGQTNVVVDASSRRHMLFSKLGTQILGFDHILELYSQDPKFSSIFAHCQQKAQRGYYVNQRYLFKERKLCIPLESHRKLLVKETHESGFMGHFWVEKTISMLKEKLFWPHMR